MTKEDALQKIEELKQFVADLESKKYAPAHGDLMLSPRKNARIVVSARDVREVHLAYDYLVFDNCGELTNFFSTPSDMGATYTKIKNVFKN